MKRTYTRVELEPISEVELTDQISKKRLGEVYTDLLLLLAQVCDEAASGNNCWLSMGTTKEKTSLVVTIHQEGGNFSVYASTLGGLALLAKELL